MTKAVQLHILALSKSFTDLLNGKFLLFFIPGGVIAILFWQVFLVANSIENSFSFLESIPLIGSVLGAGVEGTFSVLKFILDQLFVFFVLTLLSPFNTILSEKVDSSLTGKIYTFSIIAVINDLVRMIFVVLLALFLELFALGCYWVISFFIPFDFIDQIAYFLIAAFFYGFSFYDYSLERYQIGVFGSLGYAFSHFFIVTISGAIFLLIYSIPFVGVVIAPVLTTMISTIVFINKRKNNVELNSKQP